jgi:hypothetical protein
MLPALAHYFGVSVDVLIGMDQMAKAEKYDEVNRLWKENNRRGRHQENVVLMRDSLRTFPNDGLLLVQLSTSLEKLDGTKEEKAKYLRESIALQEQILRYGEDSQVRSATQYNICFSYWKNGEQKKALGSCRICTRPGRTRWCSSWRARRGMKPQKRLWSPWPGLRSSTCRFWQRPWESPPIWRKREKSAGSCWAMGKRTAPGPCRKGARMSHGMKRGDERGRLAIVLTATTALAAGNVLLRWSIGEALDSGKPGAYLPAVAALLLGVSQLLLYTRQMLSAEMRSTALPAS